MVNWVRRIRSEKLKEHQYMEECAWGLESKKVDWNEGGNIEQIWQQAKREMVDSERTQRMCNGMMWCGL